MKLTREEVVALFTPKAHLSGVDLSGVNLSGVDLKEPMLTRANLDGANLDGANLSNGYFYGATLNNASLSGAIAVDANFSGASLVGANLTGANLSGSTLRRANLNRAYLNRANLTNVDFSDASLTYALLNGANLTGAQLSRANLTEADFSGAMGLIDPIDYLDNTFKCDEVGYNVFKTFYAFNPPPPHWVIEPGSIITEVCNTNRTDDCGAGINVATYQWVTERYMGNVWRCRIHYRWGAGVIVPYNTDGKIRTSRLELLEIVRSSVEQR